MFMELDDPIAKSIRNKTTVALVRALDPATERVARSFLSAVKRQYDVAGAYVFGSQARGDATPESDTDVAILLRGRTGRRMNEAMIMADIAYDLMLETGIRVEALPLWESEWEHPETFNNPALIENIRREGVRL
jgi:uncharacterized protein